MNPTPTAKDFSDRQVVLQLSPCSSVSHRMSASPKMIQGDDNVEKWLAHDWRRGVNHCR